ncbi:MAG: formimidoylglutamate deiminase [Phycisphaerales bacterium]|nr:formimidoylglutamate deiminase [Phycisphaerales bacterium]
MSGGAIQAGLTWIDGEFVEGVRVDVGDDGRIAAVEHGSTAAVTHPRTALLPGFINAHSHAFQRGLRGLGEQFPADREDFWTWREAMYGLVESLDADRMHSLCVSAFSEMRRSGITTVGEFHYLHHVAGGAFEGDRIVLAAAAEVGIRIVLLQAHYVTGGIDQPLAGGQRSFDTSNLDAYWESFDAAQSLCVPGQTMGVVAHSIRAVPINQVVELHSQAKARGLVVHMHVEEQHAEIESCRSAYGHTPTGLLLDQLDLGSEFTAVHDTHTTAAELEAFLDRGCNVCLCPLTEANLGDGFPNRSVLHDHLGSVCIGTDSNARISMLEELRMAELGHRLDGRLRGAWPNANGMIDQPLLDMATVNGAKALGVDAGRIAPGCWADFALVDLDADTLRHVGPASLAAAMVLGADREIMLDTCIAGRWGGAG